MMDNILLKDIQEELATRLMETSSFAPDNNIKQTHFIGHFLKEKKPIKELYDMCFDRTLLQKNTVLEGDEKEGVQLHYVDNIKLPTTTGLVFVRLNRTNIVQNAMKNFRKILTKMQFSSEEEERSHTTTLIVHSFTSSFFDVMRGCFLASVAKRLASHSKKRLQCFLCTEYSVRQLHGNDFDELIRTDQWTAATNPQTPTFKENILTSKDGEKYIDTKLYMKNRTGCTFWSDLNRLELVSEDGKPSIIATRYLKIQNITLNDQLCLHISPKRNLFKVKSATFLSEYFGHNCLDNQKFLSYEEITGGDKELILSSYIESLTTSYKIRYGPKFMQGDGKEMMVRSMAMSILKLELSSTGHNKKIKLSENNPDLDFNRRENTFILYNYARLCKLERDFNKKVQEGAYGCLPEEEDLDFTCLNEPLEWILIRDYVLQFPVFFSNLLKELDKLEIPAHKIYSFLWSLSHDLSKYYKQVKVLMDCQDHLKVLIRSRFSLMMTLKEVMLFCFDLLGVVPPNQM
eukprot:TCONS_00067568-protein